MATLEIEGKRVEVDDSFRSLSPEDQQRTVDEIAAQMGISAQSAEPEGDFRLGGFRENFIGEGAVDTPGERVGEFIKNLGGTVADTAASGATGLARGAAELVGLPGTIGNLMDMGFEKIGLIPEGAAEGIQSPLSGAALRDYMSSATGGATEYVGEGVPQRIAGTVGEFIGGGAGAKLGTIGGAGSELAGMATEGTAAEPYARVAGAIAAPVGVGALKKAISPMGGQITPARQQALDTLRSEGVTPTAGQAVGGTAAQNQLYREASTAVGRARSEQALGDFTKAVMRRIGSTASRATADALEEAVTRIGKVFNDVVDGVSVMPSRDNLISMNNALKTYKQLAPKSTAAPIFKNVQKALNQSAVSGQAIPADVLKTWRSTMSKLTKSSDAAMREAAIDSMEAIDDAINSALIAARKPEAIAQLREARGQYRNLLAIEDAAKRSDIEGVLSPLQLRTALIQQGRRSYVQGKGDLSPLTRAAADVLKPLPNSGTQQRLTAGQILPGAAGGTSAGLGAVGLGLDPLTATAVGATAAIAPAIRNRFLASDAGQRYFQNQLMGQAGPAVTKKSAAGMLPGLLAQ